jgi:hypothetical protein
MKPPVYCGEAGAVNTYGGIFVHADRQRAGQP